MNLSGSRDDGYYRSFDGPSLVPSPNVSQLSPEERTAMEEEWRVELARLESEISTLRSVLDAKVRQANDLKHRLGITPMAELRRDLQHGVETIRSSESFQKTNEKLHQIGETISASEAYQKTNSALKSFGCFASRKLGDIRNSNVFKSVEGKVGGAVNSVKASMSSSQSAGNVNQLPSQPVDSLLEDDELYTSAAARHRAGAK